MSKLPTEFVKAPALAAPSKPKTAKRSRKASSLISPAPVKDPREIVLHLTEEEYQELEGARQKLHAAGSEVTLEQMIHRVFADWIVRVRAVVQPVAEPAVAPATATRDEHLLARLRAFVAAPLRSWQELATKVWQRSSLRRTLERYGAVAPR